MSLHPNTVQYGPQNIQMKAPQNNLLLYNAYNNINQGKNDTLNLNMLNSKTSSVKPIYLTTNNNNSTITNNRNCSLDKKFYPSKKYQTIDINDPSRAKRNLSSSGVLKLSRRNHRFDRVLKNGKKLKNIDINRDYDEEPEDDISSKMSSSSKIFKNKLKTSLNKNESDKSNIKSNQGINSINNNANNTNNNTKEIPIKKANTEFLVSKQKELNFKATNPQPRPTNIIPKDNDTYTINLSTIQEENPKITSEPNNIINNLGDYLKNETFHQPQDIINQEVISSSPYGKGFKYCSQFSKPGKNINGLEKTDQDTPLIYLNVGGIEGFNIFGVLDGHGNDGHFVSQFLKNYFVNKMKAYVDNLVLITPYMGVEDIYLNLKSSNFSYIVDLFLNADSELATQSNFDYVLSGTTCNLIFQFQNHLVDFNVGDSRSILVEDFGDYTTEIIQPLSVDHKPDIPEEFQRIQSYGGTVQRLQDFFGNELGPLRVFKLGSNYPGLAMSRSLGDLQAKECGVISTPQIFEYEINSNTKYFVVCSDGIWEFMTNEQVRDIGDKFYSINDAAGFCTELVNISANIWGQKENIRDDITVVAVFV